MTKVYRAVSPVLTCVLALTSFGATAGSDQAGTALDSSQDTATSQAVVAAAGRAQRSTITQTAQGLKVSAAVGTIQVPLKATGPITSGNVQIRLPDLGGGNAAVAEDGTVVYRNNGAAAETAVQATARGVRALVVAKRASAPKEYTFPVTLPAGGRLVSSAELLGAQHDTGEIIALDGAGDVVGVFGKAWAKDAQGAAVPTHYRIEGSSIVQTVDFTDATVFPVVLDPEFLTVLRCAGVIALALGTTIVPGGAIARFISRVGSIKKAATIFYRALRAARPEARTQALRNLLKNVGGSLIGVDIIANACSD
jgi:hypothetical protein